MDSNMLIIDDLKIANKTFKFHELTFNELLPISIIHPDLNEKRLTAFVNLATGSQFDAAMLTVQERYAVLVQYLMHQSENLLSVSMDFSDYKPCLGQEWKERITDNGVTVRQLYGFEAERLEADCKSVAEWLCCSVAMQLSFDSHEHLQGVLDINAADYEMQFLKRLDFIKNLPGSKWESYFNCYSELNPQLFSVLTIGVTKEGFAVRGADDAHIRFRVSTIFTNTFTELDKLYFGDSK